VFAYQRRKARGLGVVAPQTLAVLFVQRFGSLLQLNPHGHAVLADGVFVKQSDGTVALVELGPPTQSELSVIGLAIVKAVLRVLARAGDRAGDHEQLALMQSLSAAAVVGTTAHHLDRADETDNGARSSAKLATAIDSDLGRFSIHAGTHVANDDRAGLERLVRYAARPPLAQQRLSMTPKGLVCYRLRKPYYTGQTEVVLEPVAFLRRLAALVPPRRQNQVRYYGLLASQAACRDQVVGLGLALEPVPADPEPHNHTEDEEPAPSSARYRHAWAKLLARVFKHQALVCPRCNGPRTIIAAVTHTVAAHRILCHLGLPTELPQLASARAPPQLDIAERHQDWATC
jgi:hypothetical protein